MAPRWTGMWGALDTRPPSGPNTAQEKSSRSLILVEMEVLWSTLQHSQLQDNIRLVFEKKKRFFFQTMCFILERKKRFYFSNDVFFILEKKLFFFSTMLYILEKKTFFFQTMFFILEKNTFFFQTMLFILGKKNFIFSFFFSIFFLNAFILLLKMFEFNYDIRLSIKG